LVAWITPEKFLAGADMARLDEKEVATGFGEQLEFVEEPGRETAEANGCVLTRWVGKIKADVVAHEVVFGRGMSKLNYTRTKLHQN